MSRPVPSPSMNGITGWSGTTSLPFAMWILSPLGAALVMASFLRLVTGKRSSLAAMPKDRSHTKAGRGDDLAARRCVPCEEGAKALSAEQVTGLLWNVEGWKVVKGHHLTKSWEFDDFAQALAFVNRCGEVAERE